MENNNREIIYINIDDELHETVKGMISADYVERFIAEYKQAKIRYYRISEILRKANDNTLEFELTNKDLLIEQYKVMHKYITILEQRAIAEDINLG